MEIREDEPLPPVVAAGEGTTDTPADKKKPVKRKRPSKESSPPSSNSSKKPGAAAASSSSSSPAKRKPTSHPNPKQSRTLITGSAAVIAPLHTLVLDNGGDTVKYGWSNTNDASDTRSRAPASIPNLTARLPQQWTVLVGDQLLAKKFQNPNSLLSLTRSMERGTITNLGNQVQVWKRILDLLHVSIPLHTDTARAFGWKAPSETSHKTKPASSTSSLSTTAPSWISASTCAVLLTVPPWCPRTLLDQIAAVWLHDFGFLRAGFVCSSLAASFAGRKSIHNAFDTSCVVDLGWSATHIVPSIPSSFLNDTTITSTHNAVNAQQVVPSAIRRLPLAGRHLINLWKYQTSYRQWNLMDQEFILKDVLERTGVVSLEFDEWMKLASRVPAGKRHYDREYVLPDFINTFQGVVQLPHALVLNMQADQAGCDESDQQDENDSDVDEQEMLQADDDVDDVNMKGEKVEANDDSGNDDDGDDDDDDDDDDEDESPEQIRRRLLKQREEEAQRRREQEAEQQVLNISVERFAIPETLFRPSDAGLPSEWAGLPAAIVQSIEACPKPFQAALYRSIYLVGGLSQLPGLKDRLERELRSMAPCEFDVVVHASEDPMNQAWRGACVMSSDLPFETWSVRREDLLDSSSKQNNKRGVWKRMESSNGGYLV